LPKQLGDPDDGRRVRDATGERSKHPVRWGCRTRCLCAIILIGPRLRCGSVPARGNSSMMIPTARLTFSKESTLAVRALVVVV